MNRGIGSQNFSPVVGSCRTLTRFCEESCWFVSFVGPRGDELAPVLQTLAFSDGLELGVINRLCVYFSCSYTKSELRILVETDANTERCCP